MKLAIHHRKGSFSDHWIAYCEQSNIEYKLVNAYSSDIIQQVKGCDAFMWHFHQAEYKDMQFAKALILSLETAGIQCFPNSHTCWHFDNKVWEKYLLESIDAPLVPSYVFYTEKEAMKWAETVEFPKVFKLKGGAGAINVQLAHNRKEAEKFIKQAFGKGFSQYRWRIQFMENYNKYREGKSSLREVLRPVFYLFKKYPNEFSHYQQKEIGYAYFQDFIPNNSFDIRVVVVGDKAMGEKRCARKGDFRASGSGNFEYIPIRKDILQIAFQTAKRLQMQSVAFDFIFRDNEPLIVEMSYCFGTHGISHSGGYYTDDFQWHEDKELDFCGWQVENLIKAMY